MAIWQSQEWSECMITQLHVKNYRSLADITLELDPLTVLVGLNGSGKSTLVDVLSFLSDALRLSLDTAIHKRLGIHAVRGWSADERLVDIEMSLQIKIGNKLAHYRVVLGSKTKETYYLKAESCTILRNGQEIGFETKEQKWVKPLPDMQPKLQSRALLLPLIAGIAPYKEIYDVLTGMSFYNISPESLKEHQKLASAYPLQEEGQNLASVLRNLKQVNHGSAYAFKSAIEHTIPYVDDYQITSTGRHQIIQLRHTPHGSWFELGQESDGTLRMLAILTALYQQPRRTLIALEEPELNLHPGTIANLWAEITDASQHTQIMLTTHSPDLLDMCQAEQLRVVELIDGITHVGPIDEEQRQIMQANLFTAGQLLQAQGLYRAEDK